jgi:hypothetical protein
MPHKFLHVGFHFGSTLKFRELEPVFTAIGDDWIRYAFNCWIIYTPRSAADVFYFLKPHLTADDQMLIVGIDVTERNGWLAQWIWEWMDRRRQLGPPPPPTPPPPDLKNALTGLGSPSVLGTLGLAGLLSPEKKR